MRAGRVQSLSDFDGLDAPRSWFLRPKFHPTSHMALKQQIKKTESWKRGRELHFEGLRQFYVNLF